MQEVKLQFEIQGPDLDIDHIVVGRQGLKLGRGGENTLVLNHREISRQHMRISWQDDDSYSVEDLNSSNGVWLNEVRLVPRVPIQVNIGDIIRVGPYVLKAVNLIYEDMPERIIPNDPVDERILPDIIHRKAQRLPGIPSDSSTWMQYLPAVYQEDDFLGRYLLICESVMSPIIWMIDNFDLFLSPEIAPEEWLQWMASWFDLLLIPQLPLERQRRIMKQVGWLFMRRGTPSGLKRMLELYFDVVPDIIESEACHFEVILPLSESKVVFEGIEKQAIADRIIRSQKPAFASYVLKLT
ncbi:hypothetical protein MASR2M15_03050 [Anaerolineales bacterium]